MCRHANPSARVRLKTARHVNVNDPGQTQCASTAATDGVFAFCVYYALLWTFDGSGGATMAWQRSCYLGSRLPCLVDFSRHSFCVWLTLC